MESCECFTVEEKAQDMMYSANIKPWKQLMMATTQAGRLIRALQRQEMPTYWVRDMELLVWIFFILHMISGH